MSKRVNEWIKDARIVKENHSLEEIADAMHQSQHPKANGRKGAINLINRLKRKQIIWINHSLKMRRYFLLMNWEKTIKGE